MKLRNFAFLLDQNVGLNVLERLEEIGVSGTRASDLGLRAAPDFEILQMANQRGEVVLTFDLDFGFLSLVPQSCRVGIVLIKPGNLSDDQLAHAIDVLFEADFNVDNPFLVVATVRGPLVGLRSRQLS